ncbi:hypothetical protein [Micromonospora sp. DT63]|uniref:hypothetical protein n=1 Tax=Micromonospora sp. DT63 TaxID=3393441 RepID=UPI003CF1C21C
MIFRRLRERWSAEQMAAHLTQVERMIQRVPDQPALSVFAPVLDLGVSGHADIAFDYATATATATEADRPATLLGSVGQLETAKQFATTVDGGLSTARLTAMVTAVGGLPDAVSVTVQLLELISDITSGRFEDAQRFIATNQGRISTDQKAHWVNAIAELGLVMPAHQPHLKLLSEAVHNCPPKEPVGRPG